MALEIRKAERKRVPIKLAISGPAGSGKTFSALRLATGLGSKIILIDSENGSGELYGDRFSYDVISIEPPFTTEKYIEAIRLAAKHGYEVLVIDSLTHAWDGEGGLLQQKEALDKTNRNSNSFTNWASITRKHEDLKQQILQSPLHVIATMRSKTEYVLETNAHGKQVPKKVGTKAIQRDGYEFEFTIVFELDHEHTATVSKDRTSLFDGRAFTITEAAGEQVRTWLDGGHAPAPVVTAPRPAAVPAPAPVRQRDAAPESRGDRAAASAPAPVPDAEAESAKEEYKALYCRVFKCDLSTKEEGVALKAFTAKALQRPDFKWADLTLADYQTAYRKLASETVAPAA
jgi:hypothetical protein